MKPATARRYAEFVRRSRWATTFFVGACFGVVVAHLLYLWIRWSVR